MQTILELSIPSTVEKQIVADYLRKRLISREDIDVLNITFDGGKYLVKFKDRTMSAGNGGSEQI